MKDEIIVFIKADDGIRGGDVTGVQTCAVPISGGPQEIGQGGHRESTRGANIGRASCRERVYKSVDAVSRK